MSADLALLFIRAVTQQVDAEGGPASFDTSALRGLRELQAAPGRFSCILPVTPPVQNRYGTLHGGCIGEARRGLPLSLARTWTGGSLDGAVTEACRCRRRALRAGCPAALRPVAPLAPQPPQPRWSTPWARRRSSRSARAAASA